MCPSLSRCKENSSTCQAVENIHTQSPKPTFTEQTEGVTLTCPGRRAVGEASGRAHPQPKHSPGVRWHEDRQGAGEREHCLLFQ